jgi:hypothetical protein
MTADRKQQIIAGIAAAFLAALAVFYEGVVSVITDAFIAPATNEAIYQDTIDSVSE